MPIRKNKKRIDPRYFLHETAYRDELEEGIASGLSDLGAKVGLGAGGKQMAILNNVYTDMKNFWEAAASGEFRMDDKRMQMALSNLKKGMQDVYLMEDQNQAGTADAGEIVYSVVTNLIEAWEGTNLANPNKPIDLPYLERKLEDIGALMSRGARP